MEMKGWYGYDISSHRFDDEEFAAWCGHYRLQDGTLIDPTSDIAADALYWTGIINHSTDLTCIRWCPL